jgi:hypothetical protein
MTFGMPEYLFVLGIIPFLISLYLCLINRKKNVVRFSDVSVEPTMIAMKSIVAFLHI